MLNFLHPTSERVDLSEDSRFFLELLDSTHAWRERLVAELRFGEGSHVRSRSSYQIDFPPGLLKQAEIPPSSRCANLLLPLTTRQKRPLLNFGLAGPGGSPATLTSRASIASLQGQYLVLLAEASDASNALTTGVDPQLYESISAFSPGFFKTWFQEKEEMDVAVARYLTSGLGWTVPVSEVKRWRHKTNEIGEVLLSHLHELPDPTSSSEEVLLALPANDPVPMTVEAIDRLVDGLHQGVLAAHAVDDDDYLTVLAEYGRRYEVVVEVEVPLLEPSRIKIEEDLPLEVEDLEGGTWVKQVFPLGDARSAHLEARVDDAHVEITGFDVKDSQGQDAKEALESIRLTPEACAVYSSRADRPFFITVALKLSVARSLVVGAAVLSAANVVAAIAVGLVGFDGAPGSSLAALTIPTTVAAAFALVREQTALADRLQRRLRKALALTTLALWLTAAASLVVTDDSGAEDRPGSRPGDKAESVREPTSRSKVQHGKGAAEDGQKRSKGTRSNWGGAGSQPDP